MAERHTRIRYSQIKSVRPDDLDATNSLTDTYIPSYDAATEKFTWVANTGGGGATDKIEEGDTYIECIDTGDGYIIFTEDASEIMRISGGYVGIGTNNPLKKLHVVSDSYIYIERQHTGVNTGFSTNAVIFTEIDQDAIDGLGSALSFGFTDTGVTRQYLGGIGFIRHGADNESACMIRVQDGGVSRDAFYFTHDIRLGIGTDPSTELDVVGSCALTFGLNVGTTGSFGSGVIINEGGNDSDTRIEGSNETALLFIDAGEDRIGINQSSPQVKIHATSSGPCILRLDGASNYDAGLLFYEDTTRVASIFYDVSDDKVRIASNLAQDVEITVNRSGTEKVGITVKSDAGVEMPNLPTTDPVVAGELWNDSGTVKISSG